MCARRHHVHAAWILSASAFLISHLCFVGFHISNHFVCCSSTSQDYFMSSNVMAMTANSKPFCCLTQHIHLEGRHWLGCTAQQSPQPDTKGQACPNRRVLGGLGLKIALTAHHYIMECNEYALLRKSFRFRAPIYQTESSCTT